VRWLGVDVGGTDCKLAALAAAGSIGAALWAQERTGG
jgi:hypothetical protein